MFKKSQIMSQLLEKSRGVNSAILNYRRVVEGNGLTHHPRPPGQEQCINHMNKKHKKENPEKHFLDSYKTTTVLI